ncbi:MAG: hypothetical protein IPO63_17600 [Bacteroidetes bacterium]|nr:hypothetical protein [Bacteroidota bacterium]
MKMSKERNIIYLAGLLHDIGKFYQLADKNGHKKLEQLNSNIKMLEAKLCPLDNGVNFNEHILWTAQFLDEHKIVFTKLFGESTDEFINVAISYRKPENNILHQIIHKAFLFSSSFDSTSSGARKTNKLVPLLGTIGKNSNECNEHIPIEEASLSKSNFPTANSKSDSGEYMKLWENFVLNLKHYPFRLSTHLQFRSLHFY